MTRLGKLQAVFACATALLILRVLVTMLLEYRWYFPADFNGSVFLSGRQATFVGLYRAAFYAHIISGPLALVLGLGLLAIARAPRLSRVHRRLGRVQILLVLLLVAPSGLIMACGTQAGELAAYGFAALALLTGGCGVAVIQAARAGRFEAHQRWALRCCVLLCSPMLLRLNTGLLIVTQHESIWLYSLSAWLSWLIPLMFLEVWFRYSAYCHVQAALLNHARTYHQAT